MNDNKDGDSSSHDFERLKVEDKVVMDANTNYRRALIRGSISRNETHELELQWDAQARGSSSALGSPRACHVGCVVLGSPRACLNTSRQS